jgi:hypothetical protein
MVHRVWHRCGTNYPERTGRADTGRLKDHRISAQNGTSCYHLSPVIRLGLRFDSRWRYKKSLFCKSFSAFIGPPSNGLDQICRDWRSMCPSSLE